MTINKLALVMGLLYAFSASANFETEPSAPAQGTGSTIASTDFLMDYQLYSVRRAAEVEVLAGSDVDGQEAYDLVHQLLKIPEGFVLTMVDQSTDGLETTVALDLEGMLGRGEDISGLPSLIRVKTADLEALELEMIEFGPLDDEAGIDGFELPAFVAGKSGRRKGMTYCLQDVRLYAGKNCGVRPPVIERAADARSVYLKTGKWVKISRRDWASYPKCTACFYGGGRQDCGPRNKTACGHAAIKISSTKWKGAGVRTVPGLRDQTVNKPIRRRPYSFQGCIIPKHIARK